MNNDDIRKKKKSGLRENIEAILVAIVLALFIRTFVIQAFKIPSGSMKETLKIGDHILVNKFIYGVKIPFLQTTIVPITNPKHGDIVVFKLGKDFNPPDFGITKFTHLNPFKDRPPMMAWFEIGYDQNDKWVRLTEEALNYMANQ